MFLNKNPLNLASNLPGATFIVSFEYAESAMLMKCVPKSMLLKSSLVSLRWKASLSDGLLCQKYQWPWKEAEMPRGAVPSSPMRSFAKAVFLLTVVHGVKELNCVSRRVSSPFPALHRFQSLCLDSHIIISWWPAIISQRKTERRWEESLKEKHTRLMFNQRDCLEM